MESVNGILAFFIIVGGEFGVVNCSIVEGVAISSVVVDIDAEVVLVVELVVVVDVDAIDGMVAMVVVSNGVVDVTVVVSNGVVDVTVVVSNSVVDEAVVVIACDSVIRSAIGTLFHHKRL